MQPPILSQTYRIALVALGAAIVFAVPEAVLAAKIFLKSGQEIVTEAVSDQGEFVSFYYKNLMTRIPREDIDRIENDPADAPAPPPENGAADTEKKDQAPEADTAYLSHIITAISSSKRHVGYRDLIWGCSHLDIVGLEKIGEEPDFGGVETFVDPKETEKFGTADVEKIVYRFWQDKLLSITIWAADETNYAAIKQEAFNRFGRGRQSDAKAERYVWVGGPTDRYLEYDETIGKGLLWFRNRKLWHAISTPESQTNSPPLSNGPSPGPDTDAVE